MCLNFSCFITDVLVVCLIFNFSFSYFSCLLLAPVVFNLFYFPPKMHVSMAYLDGHMHFLQYDWAHFGLFFMLQKLAFSVEFFLFASQAVTLSTSLFPWSLYCFLSRFVLSFSTVNAYTLQSHVRLHILNHIVHSTQMVLWLFVLIILKGNVCEKRANTFIHLNILLHNWKLWKLKHLQLTLRYFRIQWQLQTFHVRHQLFN